MKKVIGLRVVVLSSGPDSVGALHVARDEHDVVCNLDVYSDMNRHETRRLLADTVAKATHADTGPWERMFVFDGSAQMQPLEAGTHVGPEAVVVGCCTRDRRTIRIEVIAPVYA